MDIFEKYEIEHGLSRILKIIEYGAINDPTHPLFISSITEILIHLRDLTYKSEKLKHRLDFDEDINKTDNVNDITDLIKFMRDAFCHSHVPHHYLKIKKIMASMNIIKGIGCMSINQYKHESQYSDDTAICVGHHTLYVSRHIIRSFHDLDAFFSAVLSSPTKSGDI